MEIKLKTEPIKYIDNLIKRYPVLEDQKENIICFYDMIKECYGRGGKVLIAGNGGSAADAEHMVGELMKNFRIERMLDKEFADELVKVDSELGTTLAKGLEGALPAIALDGHYALTTAYMNDNDPQLCFAQQVYGLGEQKDVFLGISTSGNSLNVLLAAVTARAKGMRVLGLTGAKNNKLSTFCDACIKVPGKESYIIQELHLPIYHCICMMLEDEFFGK